MTNNNRANVQSLLTSLGIKTPPVDVELVALSLNFIVLPCDLPTIADGRMEVRDGKKYIVVNQNHPRVRQRFTTAHEIGHFVNGHDASTYMTDDAFDYRKKDHQQEKEADRFAAELLMSRRFLERDCLSFTLEELVERYQVSSEAMNIQLSTLRLFPKHAK